MKCQACGYERRVDYQFGMYEDSTGGPPPPNVIGDQEFIGIAGHFIIEYTDDGRYGREVKLYACPKCHTIQASL